MKRLNMMERKDGDNDEPVTNEDMEGFKDLKGETKVLR
jgi:hypothetical protein